MAPHVTDQPDVPSSPIPLASRLSLDPELGRRGCLDGGWWPRSRDASIELPNLVRALNTRAGAILRLGVDARDWDDIPRRITVGGHVVRIGRFADVNHKVIVTRGPHDHILLLVVPPQAPTAAAKAALAMASIGESGCTPEEVLIASGITNEGGATTPRTAPNDDDHPCDRNPHNATLESARPMAIEDALCDERGEIGRWLDDGAPTCPRGIRTEPPAAEDDPTRPRRPDPAAELPGLILALQGPGPPGDHGPVMHILLRASDWDSQPRRLRVEGVEGLTDTRLVRLSWFETLPTGQLVVIYADGHRVDLLTDPPHTDQNAPAGVADA